MDSYLDILRQDVAENAQHYGCPHPSKWQS